MSDTRRKVPFRAERAIRQGLWWHRRPEQLQAFASKGADGQFRGDVSEAAKYGVIDPWRTAPCGKSRYKAKVLATRQVRRHQQRELRHEIKETTHG